MFSLKQFSFLSCVILLLFYSREVPKHNQELTPDNPSTENEQEYIAEVRTNISAASTFLSNYRNLGPYYAGRTLCLLIDMADTTHLLAGAESGGLWTSFNSGHTWQPVQDQFYPMTVKSITQNPFHPNMIYMCTGGFLTDSSGTDRTDLLQSIDGGATFYYVPSTYPVNERNTKVVCSRTDPNTLYVAHSLTVNANCIYRSVNNGATFRKISPDFSSMISDLEVFPNGKVMFSTGAAIYQSPSGDSGTFVNTSTGLPPGTTDINIAFCEQSPDVVYALTEWNSYIGVFKSIDGGLNWSIGDTIPMGNWGSAIAVKPDNPDVVLCGAVGFMISQDGGSSWTSWQALGVDFWSVNFNPLNPDMAYITFDGGVGNALISPFNPDPYQVQHACDSLLCNSQEYAGDYGPNGNGWIAGFQDLGTAFRSPNDTIYGVYGADGGYCFSHRQDTICAYASHQYGRLLRDNDIYNVWSNSWVDIMNQLDTNQDWTIDEGASFIQAYKVLDANSDILFYPTKKHLWKSTDKGDNWSIVSNGYTTTYSLNIDAGIGNNPTVYWTYGDTLAMLRNAVTAAVGSEVKLKLPCGIVNGVFCHPNLDTVVFISMCGNLYRSSGLFSPTPHWNSITGTLGGNGTILAFALDPQNDNFMITGTTQGLYISTDGGVIWSRETDLPPVRISMIHIRPQDRKAFFYTYGRGTWSADLPVLSGLTQFPAKSETYFSILQNPVSDQLILNFSREIKDGFIEIYSCCGQLISQFDVHGTSLSITATSNLSDGIYFLVLRKNEEILQTKKVIKQS